MDIIFTRPHRFTHAQWTPHTYKQVFGRLVGWMGIDLPADVGQKSIFCRVRMALSLTFPSQLNPLNFNSWGLRAAEQRKEFWSDSLLTQ